MTDNLKKTKLLVGKTKPASVFSEPKLIRFPHKTYFPKQNRSETHFQSLKNLCEFKLFKIESSCTS